ncbi:MAG: tetratricopeptide repeat protein [Gammaproteobacteria bacterium]|nr:MAG: tetratricopeptide repeat protein [Gammaproteobacteria bacterium]
MANTRTTGFIPVISERLRLLLTVVFALVALMLINSVYLAGITLAEYWSDKILQDSFYLWMFLAHLLIGLVLIVPFILFGLMHMRRAWRRPNRAAVRAGLALYITAIVLLISGIVLTRFGFFEINNPQVRFVSYWIHVLSPLAVVWLFVLHRLAGPRIHWQKGLQWTAIAIVFAAIMLGTHSYTAESDFSTVRNHEPALVRTMNNGMIEPRHLMDDDNCAVCHADITRSWEMSMHRNSSFNNPAYKFSVDETRDFLKVRDGDVKKSRLCAVCHDPVPLFSGKFDNPDFDSINDPTAHAGLTCISCHAITKINTPRGNGDYTLITPPRYPFAFSDNPLLKAVNHQIIKAKPEFHKKTFLKPVHKTPEFCSGCHKVHLPKAFNGYKWLRGQNHYDSFRLSGVSGHRVDSFYYPPTAIKKCATCHMPLEPSDDPAARDFNQSGQRSVHSHLFPAANTGVAQMKNMPEWVIQSHQNRMRNVTRIDIFGIREEGRVNGQLHAPLRPELPKLEPGKQYLVELVIRTTGIGHHLTQGTVDSNQLWVEVKASSDGQIIGHSGDMNSDGQVDPWSYFVNAYLLDRNGNRISRRNAQDIFVALYDHQIPPGAATVVHYLLDVPADITGPITIDAKLNYRKFDTTFIRHVLNDDQAVNNLPITEMAVDTITLPLAGTDVDQKAVNSPVQTWERWNDYGIGLLRNASSGSSKGELRQAEEAFGNVESLGYADGALNLARVWFREGRVDDAAVALQKAATMSPSAPPWTIAWYSALIDRENGELDRAINTLQDILDTKFNNARERGFDFSMDWRVHNLLGRTLFERARLERGETRRGKRIDYLNRARDAFLNTLELDPEDLTAHHNLAQVYAELGDKKNAEVHSQLRDEYRPDDHAIAQAVSAARIKNAAADHAAEAIAIYKLNRTDMNLPNHPEKLANND